ncbi:MAG: hypothetical protein V4659_07195 [Pseudomonadota bacterium]
MGPFEMVVAIVGIGAVVSVIRAKHGIRRNKNGDWTRQDDNLTAENTALKDEMRGLKERIQVLERLATDDESDAKRLDREIEKLRDRRPSRDLARDPAGE